MMRRASTTAAPAGTMAGGGRDPRDLLMTAALDAVAQGWHVFPVRPGEKRPAFPDHTAARCRGTDPRCRGGHTGWEARATTDPDRIRRAWSARPWNIGIACGPSRLLVVDLDQPKDATTVPADLAEQGVTCGLDAFLLLAADQAAGGDMTGLDTHTVTTPSGGLHLYFRAADAPRLGCTAGTLGWAVDTRGHGGYVVAAGSLTADGRAYTTTDPRTPAPLPGWLGAALAPPPPARPVPVRLSTASRADRYVAGAVAAEVARVEGATQGARNTALYVAACALGQLVAGGALAEDIARAELERAAAGALAVGAYSPGAMHGTITSGLRAGAHKPRPAPDWPARNCAKCGTAPAGWGGVLCPLCATRIAGNHPTPQHHTDEVGQLLLTATQHHTEDGGHRDRRTA